MGRARVVQTVAHRERTAGPPAGRARRRCDRFAARTSTASDAPSTMTTATTATRTTARSEWCLEIGPNPADGRRTNAGVQHRPRRARRLTVSSRPSRAGVLWTRALGGAPPSAGQVQRERDADDRPHGDGPTRCPARPEPRVRGELPRSVGPSTRSAAYRQPPIRVASPERTDRVRFPCRQRCRRARPNPPDRRIDVVHSVSLQRSSCSRPMSRRRPLANAAPPSARRWSARSPWRRGAVAGRRAWRLPTG